MLKGQKLLFPIIVKSCVQLGKACFRDEEVSSMLSIDFCSQGAQCCYRIRNATSSARIKGPLWSTDGGGLNFTLV